MPAISSMRVTGVDTSTSIVPRSHSREIVSEVSCAPTSASTIATTPGMMKSRLSRSSLNQTRYWATAGGVGGGCPRLWARCELDVAGKAADDRLGIAERDIRGVVVGRVEDRLHRGGVGRREVLEKSGGTTIAILQRPASIACFTPL